MISFIICYLNKQYLSNLSNSIEFTTNVEFEIISIDNSVFNLSLSAAYNQGAKESKYPYLVFIHEDVEFLNTTWSESLVSILKNKKNGLVGIAGSTYLPAVPSGWYLPNETLNNVFIHQGFKYSKKDMRYDNQGQDLTPVYLLDGVFLAMRKDVWKEFPFNENLKGFHVYDVDLCQRVSTKYQNIFTNQIELLHQSEGKVDKSYFQALLTYKLDMTTFNYPDRDYNLEFKILTNFVLDLRKYFDKKECVLMTKPFIKIKYLGLKRYLLFWYFLKTNFN